MNFSKVKNLTVVLLPEMCLQVLPDGLQVQYCFIENAVLHCKN